MDVHEREYIYSLRENVIYSEEPYKYIDFFMHKAVKFLMESYTVEDILNYALEEWQISIKRRPFRKDKAFRKQIDIPYKG